MSFLIFFFLKPLVEPIAQNDFAKYLAIIDVDGGGWSARLPHLLLQNSVVAKMRSAHETFAQRAMSEARALLWFENDCADLRRTLHAVLRNVTAAAAQIERQRRFVATQLASEKIYLYWLELVLRYAALQRFAPLVLAQRAAFVRFEPCAAARTRETCAAHRIRHIEVQCEWSAALNDCVASSWRSAQLRSVR